ncbi:TPA: hypothetical protein I9236_003133 [Citrobacter freundii]|jgi:hypothetical protein|uniref:Excisionase family protein n=1 Tax=Citrobacter freundii TaxID=546 RepID=A0AAN4JDQ7_CITFR|nr:MULTISPECIES: excisionase family protein [Citrobacter]KDF18387.1 hypothetical protein AF42_01714 [Citrobacter freundii MGH 56]DAU03121.1 MAG TPA: putative excisionase [Bacteriophage sp.]EJC8216318.1 excisionase family protein [Citrobacter freundii]EJM7589230.1 excisionase family protein [Citrobacter freundii]EKU2180306.1 excisionase family protein [Citrobacter freundii]
MPDIVFNEEWVVETRLSERTGLSKGQIKNYRLGVWIEGVHFKHLTALGETSSSNGVLWYNYPRINKFVQEA